MNIVLVRWFIHGAWASMHCCFVMARKPLITAEFITVCCSMSMVSKTSCSHFSAQGSYYATHTLGHNVVVTRLNLWHLMSVIVYDPYLKGTQLLCMIWWYHLWAAWSCLSWFAVAFSRSIVVELDSKGTGPLTSAHVYGIGSFNLDFWYMAIRKQTYTHALQCSFASVGLAQARPNKIYS